MRVGRSGSTPGPSMPANAPTAGLPRLGTESGSSVPARSESSVPPRSWVDGRVVPKGRAGLAMYLGTTGLLTLVPSLAAADIGRAAPEAGGFERVPVTTLDGFSQKIRAWQYRESKDSGPLPTSTPLAKAYAEFRDQATGSADRRDIARDLVRMLQREARAHFKPEIIDSWATLRETLARGKEDCDGLERMGSQLLLERGFPPNEVFRAIIRNAETNEHHMVTFWFENPGDPWVIDPTGAATSKLTRLSRMDDWKPVRAFNGTDEFELRGR